MRKILVRVVAVAALTLAGGSLDGAKTGGGASAEPERTLKIGIWSNYMPDEVLRGFEKEQHCTVSIPWYYGSNDELLGKLEGKDTGLDLVVPSDLILAVLVKKGLIERVEAAKVPNVSHLDPAFLGREADPKNEWSVPYTWGTVGIAWRTDKITTPIDSWGVFATDAASGNAFLLEEGRDVAAAALLFHGKSVNAVDTTSLAEAKATLLDWKKHVKGFTGEVKNQLLSREAWLCQAYNGDVAQAMQEMKGTFAFAVPKEGGVLWVDNFVIPKGAPSKDLALAFMDYVLRPEIAALVSNKIKYAVPNKDAWPLVDESVKNDPVIYAPEAVRKRCQQERDLGSDLKKITDLWSEVRGE